MNQGPAIAPELIPALFEPFRRGAGTRDSSHARGLGLGLYIVRLIVTADGGGSASSRRSSTALRSR